MNPLTALCLVQVCPSEGKKHASNSGAGGQATEVANAKSRALRKGRLVGGHSDPCLPGVKLKGNKVILLIFFSSTVPTVPHKNILSQVLRTFAVPSFSVATYRWILIFFLSSYLGVKLPGSMLSMLSLVSFLGQPCIYGRFIHGGSPV